MDNLAPGVENEGGFDGKGRPNSDKDGRFPPDISPNRPVWST